MGMVGGGSNAFIGAVHRMGAGLDGQIELVCGAFSSSPERSKQSGRDLYLPEDRVYETFEEMFEKEAQLPADQRMDFVSIVTQNNMHFAPAMLALENGFPVMIDKPLCFTMEEAHALRAKVKETGLPFGLTYTYAFYPMIQQARAMVKAGEIGKVRKVMMEYPQGWLNGKLEDTGQKQASWRSDPARAGISNCFGDIGTHCAHMAEYVSGLKITEVLSEITAFVEGRTLDDDANVLIHLEDGANGVISASQVSHGEENNIKMRIYGEKGGLEWNNTDHNSLIVKVHGTPNRTFRAGGDNGGYLSEKAMAHTRTPSGHPEGYVEAFANIYRNFSLMIKQHKWGVSYDEAILDVPDIDDGFKGMAMVSAVVQSTKNGNVWTKVER
ncbi:MAG: Gfo/Idh/MocA family oxidoreductase [Cyclobacteriaceae bacterium]